ncbi:hypothetical protein HS088_TW02G00732 [Tripterygium wilfordii]|uniref:Uncharacterized protein n=1 Tax=Tripterygium wilfordii TaxID=458696 RepID=A0A7J7DZA7_TRIWF|nr:hypothetical protein HS088_TW02G00732 [Tripterygium wilfordii]
MSGPNTTIFTFILQKLKTQQIHNQNPVFEHCNNLSVDFVLGHNQNPANTQWKPRKKILNMKARGAEKNKQKIMKATGVIKIERELRRHCIRWTLVFDGVESSTDPCLQRIGVFDEGAVFDGAEFLTVATSSYFTNFVRSGQGVRNMEREVMERFDENSPKIGVYSIFWLGEHDS